VFVEVKARFNEKRNISWAERLERAGVIVIYGIKKLKVHAKLLLVIRRGSGGLQRYVHFSTGNYNEKTACLYSDLSLFTTDNSIAQDATVFFNMLSGYSALETMKDLSLAPVNLKERLLALIERETAASTPGRPGLIVAKVNSLTHEEIISALYRASEAGVRVLLNVRGVCMLVPGVAGMSENITVRSIVGHYLEHARAMYFANNGRPEVYLSSADWMPRNLDRRVELMVPVKQTDLAERVKGILDLCFADNQNAWELHADGTWTPVAPKPGEAPLSAQQELQRRAFADSKSSRIDDFVVRRRKEPTRKIGDTMWRGSLSIPRL
jgi:polyphosphate kinase